MNTSNSLDLVFLQEPFSTVFVILQDVLIAELQGALFTTVLSDWYPPELGSKSQMYFFVCLFVFISQLHLLSGFVKECRGAMTWKHEENVNFFTPKF